MRTARRIEVVKYLEEHDMRFRIDDRDLARKHKLQRGQCILALNTRTTMARIIDCNGGLHDWAAPQGEYFDAQSIRDLVWHGLFLELALEGRAENVTPIAA